jgi:GNAT superfamily N-acetyltransferase
MKKGSPTVALSALDEKRFGIKSAKASLQGAEDLPEVMGFCQEHGVRFLIARCPTRELKAVQELERLGFLLMDTLIYYSCSLERESIPDGEEGAAVRLIRPGEEDQVKCVAKESFKGYCGHYHADERLDRKTCDEVYTDWAYNSCISREVAAAVLVGELGGKVQAFATLSLRSPQEGEGVLFGVAPAFHGKGIYRQLMINGMKWCVEQGLQHMLVSTQIINTAVQKVWVRLGFEPGMSYYTFHKWFAD